MGHYVKTVNQDERVKELYQCDWLIEKTVEFQDLVIHRGAKISAPAGKEITLIVNGMVRQLKPGHYVGKVILSVAEVFAVDPPEIIMSISNIVPTFVSAISVDKNKIDEAKSNKDAVWGGTFDGSHAEDIYIGSDQENFAGIVVNDSKYDIKNVAMDLDGFAMNDYVGVGAGVACFGKSDVTVRDSRFTLSAVSRCAIHISNESKILLEDSEFTNISPDTDWFDRFCWPLPFVGSNRLLQLSNRGQMTINRCKMHTNGWGILSIDSADQDILLTVKDSHLLVSGPRSHAYGVFVFATSKVRFDHTTVDVYGYPICLMGMERIAGVDIVNGCVIKGRRFGLFASTDDHSIVNIKDSTFDTDRACIASRSSITKYNIENSVMKSHEGIIVQIMDNLTEYSQEAVKCFVPVGVEDTYIEGRDITNYNTENDVEFNFSHMTLEGDILNSTTNIRAYENSIIETKGEYHDRIAGPTKDLYEFAIGPDADYASYNELHGPKNLGLNFVSTAITGVISSATQAWREGLTEITPDSRLEGANITQTPAAPVNNGVIVNLDKDSSWTVTGTSYITSLTLASSAQVIAPGGKKLAVYVNGEETTLEAGEYKGQITLSLK